MCGIVGFIGQKPATEVLVNGLDRLSYRGYDSAGVAVMDERGRITVRKAKGKLDQLKYLLDQKPLSGTAGIGHTRWATWRTKRSECSSAYRYPGRHRGCA